MIRKTIIILFVFCSYSLANTKIYNDLVSETREDILQPETFSSNLDVELKSKNESNIECKCGPHSTGCNITDGRKLCYCEEGYVLGLDEKCTECKCGPHSTGCNIRDGLKTCTCEEGYVPGINENCTEMYNDTHKCQNGGTCFNGICLCPPRTRGTFCEEIYVICWNFLYEKIAGYHGQSCCCYANLTAECKYDVKKSDAYCECPGKNEVYDDLDMKCKECTCGESGTWSKCDFYGGVKTCFCKKNYQYNRKTEVCEPCSCSGNSNKCEFSWDGDIDCNCWKGYQQYNTSCLECDCGSDGTCELREGKKICHCNSGFQVWNGTCLGCDCGSFGECVYDDTGKKNECSCDVGYANKAGKCEFCYCGENSKCSLDEFGNKTCQCSYGYKDVLGFCRDINECENSTNLCPKNEKCVNIPGGYVCGCADGYIKTSAGCSDINECENSKVCGGANSECVNVPGNFECRCKSGYFTRGGKKTQLLCQSNSAFKVGYGLLGGFFSAVVIILLTILYRIYRSQ